MVFLLVVEIAFFIASAIFAGIAASKSFSEEDGWLFACIFCMAVSIALCISVFNMTIGVPATTQKLDFDEWYHVTAVDAKESPDFINVIAVDKNYSPRLYAVPRLLAPNLKVGNNFRKKTIGEATVIEIQ